MIQLIVGLGNPGSEYYDTCHNVGFWVVDAFVERQSEKSVKTHRNHRAKMFHVRRLGGDLWLAKPGTYMNLSGNSVAPMVKDLGLEAEEVLIVHDEADLSPGVVRLKLGGGAGGHRGLTSIFDRWVERDFYRLRMGVGKDPELALSDHVLRPISSEVLRSWGQAGADALELILGEGPVAAMNQLNRRLDSPEESC